MRKVPLFAAVGVFIPTFAAAELATVTSGVKTEITTHMRYDSHCQANNVAIKIVAAPANGTVTTETKPISVRRASRFLGDRSWPSLLSLRGAGGPRSLADVI